jgi:5'-methylthioadenosine phosphorylase
MVTDHDAGVEAGEEVTHAEVMRVFANNIERLKSLLLRVIAELPAAEPDESALCSCRRVHDGQKLPFLLP